MESRRNLKRAVAAVLAGVLIGAGITTVTPAGAEVSQFAGTHWKKIWKKKLQPQADKRYYAKTASDSKYATKAETGAALGNYYTKVQADAALGGYYTKAQSDAAYATKSQSYTKVESDARYAPTPSLIRGTYDIIGYANAAGAELGENLTFGWTLPAAPIAHYINVGTAPPAGCSGSVEAPNAAPGHLCVFESTNVRGSARRTISASGSYGLASTFGAGVTATATVAGNVYVYGSWAVRPATAVGPQGAASLQAPATQDGARAGD